MKPLFIAIFFTCFSFLQAAAKPNFVFLLGDDMNRDSFGCYGGGVTCNTPNFDQLAADGVRFAKAYTSIAMCAPFRQEIYSGRTPWRTKTFLNHSNSVKGTKSLPHYLKPLGYRVGLAGKQHYGPQDSYPFEHLGGTDSNDEFMAKATKFIEAAQSESAPFCLFVCSHDAHSAYTNGDASQYDPKSLNIPPYWVDTPALRRSLPPYLAEITNFDALAGRIRGYLDEQDLAKDTIFFVCTEQGSAFPFAKWTCFDNGLHTGLVAYSPGRFPAGTVSEELLWMCDIAPTIVEAAGGAIAPDDFDGKSQLANLIGTPTKVHDHVFGAFSNKGIIDNRKRIYPIRTIRDGRYSLIYSPNHEEITSNVTLSPALALLESNGAAKNKKGESTLSWVEANGANDPFVKKLFHRPEYALYDLEKDPYELQNLSQNPEHQPTFERLKSSLHTFLTANDDADPIATEKAVTTNKSPKKGNKGAKKPKTK